ncbi:hypothetical protein BRYFOR_05488 [Marvinbryantia formatexigens DSM 14469]|uniref:Uncharacterized protein n=1 Tax=Marvinbryantia formatexigens DSM 14469 TaxID=478749 RepID=C6LA46_9FIRM|nr:hypothetical protein BRYFOR_05488 [Marvinbryantia formatexigens DSM 14469]
MMLCNFSHKFFSFCCDEIPVLATYFPIIKQTGKYTDLRCFSNNKLYKRKAGDSSSRCFVYQTWKAGIEVFQGVFFRVAFRVA